MGYLRRLHRTFALALLLSAPAIAEAGPPLICHPFQTSGWELLPWGSGPGWNSPDPAYDVQRLTSDLMRLLASEAPVLARMENMRRATIYAYAAPDTRVAEQVLAAVLARSARASAPAPDALFDAGYLVESYQQAAVIYKRPSPEMDGYSMVARAIASGGKNPSMELAASLMSTGALARAHLERARAGASAEPLLARNIETLWK